MVQAGDDRGKHEDKRLSSGRVSRVLIVYEMGAVARLNACMLHHEMSSTVTGGYDKREAIDG